MINKRKIIKKYKFDTTITYMTYKRVVNVLLKQGFVSQFTDLSNRYPDYLEREAGEILEEIRKG